ncbi:unnamed protein product [Schistocephalus solidus]|uniref:Uncharacterized protein n=1 Tax=Schistocephalus solidus TaxID=70667 RepID=A0A183TK62_SCHSO|nr:unnamed protein product [Schistocephalus solidus]
MLINALGCPCQPQKSPSTRGAVVDFQRQFQVLPRQAYPNEPFTESEARILENFVDEICLPEINRQFLGDPPSSIKVALDIAWHEEAIHTACPLVEGSSL